MELTDAQKALMQVLTGISSEVEDLKGKVPDKAIDKKTGKLKWENLDTPVEYLGKAITLPDHPQRMPIPAAIAALQAKAKDEETPFAVREVIDAFPLDGAVALVKAIRTLYGWAMNVPTPGFFGSSPPQFITVDVGPDEEDKIQVPWGNFSIPGVENPIGVSVDGGRYGPVLVVYGTVRKKESHIIRELCDLARKIVKAESIYRGQALRIRSEGSQLDMDNPPEFVQTRDASTEEWIMPRDVEDLIRTNIWTLIEKTEACREARIPLKRGVLLEGPYGTGKTITALLTAKKCVENGWTCIMLDRVQGLKTALEFAKRYEPCVIFAEDIDRATEDRDEQANDLLNILDGALSKSSNIMVVLTTNHVENINQAMLRPGRLDAVISVRRPDAEAVERLVHIYGRGRLEADINLSAVGGELAGQIPATVREVVERAKLAAIGRGARLISGDDLVVAAKGMKHHLALLNRSKGRVLTAEERLGKAMADVVAEKTGSTVSKASALLMAQNCTAIGAGPPTPDGYRLEKIGDLALDIEQVISPKSGIFEFVPDDDQDQEAA